MNFDYAIHSDFLIHWTGKDIDDEYDKPWYESDKSKTNKNCTIKYIKRLHDILKFGFWMNKKTDPETIKVNGKEFNKPLVARTCFTELKLSEARQHAKKFGRLGIGVKRYYLFNRLGSPMKYVQFNTQNLSFPPYSTYDKDNPQYERFSFYKHMCSGRPLTYDLFSESEWRIIYSENIEGKLKKQEPNPSSLFVNPQESNFTKLKEFYDSIQGEKPEYFLPLDGWFAMIIYPSLDVKNTAQKYIKEQNKNTRETEYKLNDIQKEIKKIKSLNDNANKVEGGNWPIEVNLDACRNF